MRINGACHCGSVSVTAEPMTDGFAKATYRQRIAHFTEELDFLSEDDKDWVMGRGILARLKWV